MGMRVLAALFTLQVKRRLPGPRLLRSASLTRFRLTIFDITTYFIAVGLFGRANAPHLWKMRARAGGPIVGRSA